MSEDAVRDVCRDEGVPIDEDPLGGKFVWLSELAPLTAEVGRLRADLADAQRERDALAAERDAMQQDLDQRIEAVTASMREHLAVCRALSAGGGAPAEGDLIGYRVRLTNADDAEADWGLFAPEDVQIVRVGQPAASSGRAADTERQQG